MPKPMQRIAAALFATCVAASHLPAQVITPMSDGRLIDVNGKLITEVFGLTGTDEATAVVRVNNDRLILLRVGRTEFLPLTGTGTSQTLYFESTDCSGQAWMTKDKGNFGRSYRLQGPDQTLYLGDPSTQQLVTARSQRDKELVCQPFGPFEISVLVADPVTDLLVEFTPPFIVFAPKQ